MPTTYSQATLATFFQTNDVPTGSDFENLIYSQINVVNTGAQSMASSLTAVELIAPRVSAGNVKVTGSISIDGVTSAVGVFANSLSVASTLVVPTVSASLIYADSLIAANSIIQTVLTIAASGTTLATAQPLAATINRLTTVSDGTATGVKLLANLTGLTQYLYNETATSANLWPCTGGQINALGSGAAFALAGSTLYTIVHTKASGYAVK